MALISSLTKEEAGEIAREIYEGFEEQGKEVPEWVKVMAHRPEILKEFFELFKVIMGEGKIEKILKWRIAYTISKTLKCPFCVDVTTKMLKKMGASEEEIKKAEKIEELTGKEADIIKLVKEVTKEAHISSPNLFEKMKENFQEEEIVEIVSIIGLFNYINRFNNTFGILPQ